MYLHNAILNFKLNQSTVNKSTVWLSLYL